jgi:hypothetical protein
VRLGVTNACYSAAPSVRAVTGLLLAVVVLAVPAAPVPGATAHRVRPVRGQRTVILSLPVLATR